MRHKPASIFKRAIAYALDMCICCFTSFFLMFFYLKTFTNFDGTDFYDILYLSAIAGKLTGLLTSPIYFICFEQSKFQATLGKMLFNLKVMNLDGRKLSFLDACLRTFLYTLIYHICFFYKKFSCFPTPKCSILSFLTIKAAKATPPGYLMLVIIRVFWFITIIFNKNRMGVYEMLSKTMVVEGIKPEERQNARQGVSC